MIQGTSPRFLLASTSPRRRELLEKIGIPFVVVENPWEEVAYPRESARRQALRLSSEKLAHYLKTHPGTALPVLTADTLVGYKGRPFGKPSNEDEALAFYRRLAGRRHQVYTAYSLYLPSRSQVVRGVETSHVRFVEWNETVYRDYLATGEWKDAAGGYKIQGFGERLVDSVTGSWSNIVGLPIAKIYGILRQYLNLT